MKSIPLKCTSCGSNLEITTEMSTFACGYCGASQIVERYGGTISLKLVSDAIRNVQIGTDRTAAELALKRLSQELQEVEQNYSIAYVFNKSRDEANSKTYGILWLVSIFVCLVLVGQGGFATIAGALLGIFVTVGARYLWYRKKTVIELDFAEKSQEIFQQRIRIRNKIAENRRFVDS